MLGKVTETTCCHVSEAFTKKREKLSESTKRIETIQIVLKMVLNVATFFKDYSHFTASNIMSAAAYSLPNFS